MNKLSIKERVSDLENGVTIPLDKKRIERTFIMGYPLTRSVTKKILSTAEAVQLLIDFLKVKYKEVEHVEDKLIK